MLLSLLQIISLFKLSLIVVIRQLTSASRIVFSKNHIHGTRTLSMSMHTNRADMGTRLHETRVVNYKNQTEQPLHRPSRPPKLGSSLYMKYSYLISWVFHFASFAIVKKIAKFKQKIQMSQKKTFQLVIAKK